MLVAVSLEVIVESTLASALERLTERSPLGARIVYYVAESDMTVERRLNMLKELTGVDYNKVSKGLGEAAFPTSWKQLRENRNQFVHHGVSCAFEAGSELELLSIARAATKVFAEINNLVWTKRYD